MCSPIVKFRVGPKNNVIFELVVELIQNWGDGQLIFVDVDFIDMKSSCRVPKLVLQQKE